MKIAKVINKKSVNAQGFTLIELLVSVGVFVVVMTISLGSVISILDAGRKAKALKSVMTNLNFALEVMAREIKFGENYYCGIDTNSPHTQTGSCTSTPGTAITFTSSEGVDTIYRLQGTEIEKSIDHGGTYIGVTSPEVTVTDLRFYVFGTAPIPDTNQPKALIFIRGYAGNKPTAQSNFVLQTTVSQRPLDR
jgi:prepilin-type N-terminal cleavage/methylation domain-containing protein